MMTTPATELLAVVVPLLAASDTQAGLSYVETGDAAPCALSSMSLPRLTASSTPDRRATEPPTRDDILTTSESIRTAT